MPPCLVHIGYHKTASTWIQMHLFTEDHGYAQLASHDEIFRTLVAPHNFVWDPAPARDLVAERRARIAPEVVPTLSSEILSGSIFHGGRENDVYAERLHAALPEARILISIRSQLRILPSVYMQYLFRGGRRRPEAFFAGEATPGFFGFDPVHFEYDRLVAHYQALFGRDRVYVMTQESLAADLDAAARSLAEFAGATRFSGLTDAARRVQSASYPEAAAGTLRRSNHFRRALFNPEPPLPGNLGALAYRSGGWLWRRGPLSGYARGRRPIGDLVAARFATRFTESNRRLAGLVSHPIDLSNYP